MISIYYDGDCPFCTRYVSYLRLKEAAGEVALVDVRRDATSLERLTQAGYSLDQGMVVEIDGRAMAGAEAMHALALMTSPRGFFNKLNYYLFSHRYLALLLYPLLRMGRNLFLLLDGRSPLHEQRKDEDTRLLTLFSACWGLFSVTHAVFVFNFSEPFPSTYLIGAMGVWLIFHPYCRRTLLLLFGAMLVDAWLHMPTNSNHTILKNFFLLAVLLAGLYSALRGRGWAAFFRDVVPIGRALLLIMYVFGVFHKINTGFLNPDVTCAMALWQEMPPPLQWLNTTWFAYLASYGTLVIESVILVFLLIPSLRHWGILVGIVFHLFLALSGYAFYVAFSMLSLVMHVLFLTPQAAGRIIDAPLWRRAMGLWNSFWGKLLILAYGFALILNSAMGSYTTVALLWFAVVLPLCWLILQHGKEPVQNEPRNIFISRRWWLNVVTLLFFFNCITPYLGLKTAQSMNMFANLRLEGGASNHLVLRNAPGPFGYLEDVVAIHSVSGSPLLNYVQRKNLHVTYYFLLDHLDRNPWVIVTYERDGEVYPHMTEMNLRDEMERVLHPRWFRNWFHFRIVDLKEPTVCENSR
ncbi:DCC1-like thiol-disulfide oxidoreductase family protein [Marinimicrobium sp. ABcell2]|uniref:DCC1-like thiol-disulfide oxidoreductase family protein n=1 Tax=Marinimicrobium sp. ABcell2 TaxID=3069751 RepID=UPI0027B411A2|nr:DCC1-like thiol-disulfide oxidoreductase family protein [Marinimicrobium sp. ABcell2]MDQ2077734.1 DCC1-like thiol-disulfide oxidoreductase family protein [Marinimicrobium sp. ABcell2]